MGGSQALSSMDTKSPKVLRTSHGRDQLLSIAPWAKLAVTPSLDKFRDDRTHPASVRSLYVVHVSFYVQPEPPDLNG